MLEEFKNCLPDRIVANLNERKVSSMSEAAVLADEFLLTHKNVYKQTRVEPSLLIDCQSKTVQSSWSKFPS